MSPPPEKIDGARVLAWAYSAPHAFGFLISSEAKNVSPNQLSLSMCETKIAIHALAICQYQGDIKFYRFSCDKSWESHQDESYESFDHAIKYLPKQYQEVKVNWHRVDDKKHKQEEIN